MICFQGHSNVLPLTIDDKLEEQRLRMNLQEDMLRIFIRALKNLAEAYKYKKDIIADYRDKKRTQEIVKERMAAEINYETAKEEFANTIISLQIDLD